MLEQTISDLFEQLGHTLVVVDEKGNKTEVTPTDNEIETILDRAVQELYTEKVGNRFNGAKLIVEKRPIGYDVYLYVGHYI
jgi:hypothetical protein